MFVGLHECFGLMLVERLQTFCKFTDFLLIFSLKNIRGSSEYRHSLVRQHGRAWAGCRPWKVVQEWGSIADFSWALSLNISLSLSLSHYHRSSTSKLGNNCLHPSTARMRFVTTSKQQCNTGWFNGLFTINAALDKTRHAQIDNMQHRKCPSVPMLNKQHYDRKLQTYKSRLMSMLSWSWSYETNCNTHWATNTHYVLSCKWALCTREYNTMSWQIQTISHIDAM